ncbi:MAG: tetratricopeptide repeat protein, partial [Alphaproteobacteria bacterium]
MRFHLLGLVLMAGVAMPAYAQSNNVERRVGKLEQEMQAVQRRVFPNGQPVRPEIEERVEPGFSGGSPASSPVADLTARVDALESQLSSLTNQVETDSNRIRRLEEALNQLRDSNGARLDALERSPAPAPEASAPAEPVREPARKPTAERAPVKPTTPATLASTGGADDEVQSAYDDGFHLWEQKRYADAVKALEGVATKYPRHRLASWASNLAGRAYLDDGKPATAAKVFLANYQSNPRGERAADSLYFLGQALVRLKKLPEACKVYDELDDVYGANMRDFVKQRLPAARNEAKCR